MENDVTDALKLLNLSIGLDKLRTGSNKLDEILKGGLEYGKITEIYGEAGTGKSQFILQLAVSIAKMGSEVVILDTEGKLSTPRLLQIADGNANILERVLVRRCRDKDELLAAVLLLPPLVRIKPKIRAIFVDSIAQPFRYTGQDKTEISKTPGQLYRITSILNELAYENNIAVVLTNQVTTKINAEESSLVPALGDAWRYAAATRILTKYPNLQDKNEEYEIGTRMAVLEKCSAIRTGVEASFLIGESGISDL